VASLKSLRGRLVETDESGAGQAQPTNNICSLPVAGEPTKAPAEPAWQISGYYGVTPVPGPSPWAALSGVAQRQGAGSRAGMIVVLKIEFEGGGSQMAKKKPEPVVSGKKGKGGKKVKAKAKKK